MRNAKTREYLKLLSQAMPIKLTGGSLLAGELSEDALQAPSSFAPVIYVPCRRLCAILLVTSLDH